MADMSDERLDELDSLLATGRFTADEGNELLAAVRVLRRERDALLSLPPEAIPTETAIEVFRKSAEQHDENGLPFDWRLVPNQWVLGERAVTEKAVASVEAERDAETARRPSVFDLDAARAEAERLRGLLREIYDGGSFDSELDARIRAELGGGDG